MGVLFQSFEKSKSFERTLIPEALLEEMWEFYRPNRVCDSDHCNNGVDTHEEGKIVVSIDGEMQVYDYGHGKTKVHLVDDEIALACCNECYHTYSYCPQCRMFVRANTIKLPFGKQDFCPF